jgi:pyruvate dehydrogenase E1 component alpha subunit
MEAKPKFGIEYHRLIDERGVAVGPLPEFARDARNLVSMYRAILLTRRFDEKAVALQRTGKLGTYASSLGQEAVGVGVAASMNEKDVLLPSFREQSAMIWRGVTMTEMLLYWGGDERGNDFAGPRHDFPICVPVSTHFPHAVGVAYALKHLKRDAVAVAIAGDGATSKGDFYEALNAAGVWQLPVVFIINNNQWAISVPRSSQSAAETLAQKAIAAGIAGIQVDGNDVVAVRQIAEEAIERARQGQGATVIEALTYRLGDHTTADDASRYRDDVEVSGHWKFEPVRRLKAYLESSGGWNSADEESLLGEVNEIVAKAVNEYLNTAPPAADSMFNYLFAEVPRSLRSQRLVFSKGDRGHA